MSDTDTRYLSAQVSNEFYWELKKKIAERQETMQDAIVESLCQRFSLKHPERKGGAVDEPSDRPVSPKRNTRSHETLPTK